MKFSLIIPIGPGRNAEILESIKKLNYPKNQFEVLVERGLNPSENRNRGIKRARGEFLVFLDDDALIDKDYLTKIEEFFEKNTKVDIVGGPQLSPKNGENFFARISGLVLTSNFGAFKVNKRYIKNSGAYEASQTDLTSANLCIKKNVFKKLGGFNTKLYPGEDPELINRSKKNGFKVYYNPEMIIYHKRRASLVKYIKQIFNYGITRPKLNRISGKGGLLFLIPMFFLIYLVLLPTMLLITELFILPLIFYAILSVVFGAVDSIKNKLLVGIILLPFLYFVTHVSYGFGVLIGYTKRI